MNDQKDNPDNPDETNDAETDSELHMNEILASIRKIIALDIDDGQPQKNREDEHISGADLMNSGDLEFESWKDQINTHIEDIEIPHPGKDVTDTAQIGATVEVAFDENADLVTEPQQEPPSSVESQPVSMGKAASDVTDIKKVRELMAHLTSQNSHLEEDLPVTPVSSAQQIPPEQTSPALQPPPVIPPSPLPASEADSISALFTAILRPLIKTWLDANLPAMVEKAVAEQIQRARSGD